MDKKKMLETELDYAQKMLQKINDKGDRNLVEAFDRAISEHRERTAFSCLGQDLSFLELDRNSKAFAAFLHASDIKPGSRIALQMPNILAYPIVVWGALRAGVVIVNTNPMYTERELRHQFTDAGIDALVLFEGCLAVTAPVAEELGVRLVVVAGALKPDSSQVLPQGCPDRYVALGTALATPNTATIETTNVSMESLAVLQYTGGTTGPSKGAMLTHGNLFASAWQTTSALDENERSDGIVIAPMPLYHIYGFTWNVISCCMNGVHSVLIPDPRNLDSLVQAMRAYRFTGFAGVNTLFAGLMRHPQFDEIDFSYLRGSIAGGAALVTSVAEEWERRTGSKLFEGYAMSETSSSLTCNTPDANQIGTVGKPLPAMEVKVIDSEGADLGIEKVGELAVRGPQVLKGYWNRPAETAAAVDSDGWFRTGDVAVIQADGFLRIVDRIKDMILVSGFNVYPNEIEDVLTAHPDVFECAAVGVADERTGEAIKVFVVPSGAARDAEVLRDYCRRQLTAYKVPKHIAFVDALPKSAVGKVLRRELRTP
ncbi:AMP-binding protein [Biformimicrobium ophioploci]|uniref:Long-chain-fatty-acid--CoA ligase n=1 Tax=Biformimicrobium ophioploci TaxID=3036711 RepID=A0ABQ6LVL7_9GAMM|nr:AMP-binding protein [Microbulbifer sp. NKW57]GMG86128.1 long-chain-fatty-acid--CoA ligase FadD2 [Microbulbifer sp. NKW57]